MRDREVDMLAQRINHTLDWSSIDSGTREILRQLFRELIAYLQNHRTL